MAQLLDIVPKDATNRSVTLRIIDSTDGTPETGVVWNTAGIDLWYRREGAAKTSITEATLAALTTAHTDGGFLHIGDGEYRLDVPDAAFATAAEHVDIGGTVTGMVVIGGRVRLTDLNPEVAMRGTDSAATAAALATVDSNVDAILIDTAEIGAAGAGLTDLGGMSTGMKAEVNAEADTALTDYDPPTNAEMEARTLAAGPLAQLTQNLDNDIAGTASGTPSTTALVSDIAVTVDDQFKGRIITFDDDTTTAAMRKQSTDITGCTASTNTLTYTALTTAPVSGDKFTIT